MDIAQSIEASFAALRAGIVGIDQSVPLLDGTHRTYTYLDNAASTPSFRVVQEKVNELLPWYSSVHRGMGLKSLVSSQAYDQAHEIVADFVGADPEQDCVIFGKNTTEAINTLAYAFPWQPGDIVVTSLMEHHSDDLPWRANAQVVRIGVDAEGALDLAALRSQLEWYKGRVRLVAITGASNVTGFTPPIHEIAAWAHQAGALILVDCAQLAPHRAIDMRPHSDPGHLDFVSLSAHKMYAPFGSGALVGPREFFGQNPPFMRGGGTIEVVTTDEVHWAEPPERNEAGSPNVLGAVAMGASLKLLKQTGMDQLAEHEKNLTCRTLQALQALPDVQVFGSADPDRLDDRLGVISFSVKGVHHAKVAAILGFEAGIGVRNGCFCAHPYLLHMLAVRGPVYDNFKREALSHNRRNIPGLVRASFGCYNTTDEVDYLVEWLGRIAGGRYQGHYVQETRSGAFYPEGYSPASLEPYFHI